ncbi:ROK family transcriptional regulator [Tropicimonas sp. IMCC34043]|uniref:ROK family transcriptional regulator n=1 Tax=Tropicimonas sp. IMCC34043 TaxID=2248760 RepID=UPI000E2836B8|nr:ROK family transcriptional regulator [Tropicimonas sp. IMCC34043]
MRAHNERLVLSTLRRNGPMAKSEIARVTGLSAQASSVIMRSLEQGGFLRRGDPIRGKVGQPSIPMYLSPDGAFFFGLKVGRRSVDLILINFVGEVLGRVHRTYRFPTPDSILKFTSEAFDTLGGLIPPEHRDRIAGLGVGIPFRLWDWAASIGAPADEMEAWRTRDLRTELEAVLGCPVFLQNDASAACGAELVFGKADRPESFFHFFIGYFIGGGLVLNNRLFTGTTGNAAAIGSLPIRGAEGKALQLVDIASLSVLETALTAAGKPPGGLWEVPESWSIDQTVLESWVRDASSGIAQAIAAVCSVVDVEAILIDGWLPASLRRQIVTSTAAALRELDVSGIVKPVVREGSIGPDARSLGAASLPLSERYLVDLNAVLTAG